MIGTLYGAPVAWTQLLNLRSLDLPTYLGPKRYLCLLFVSFVPCWLMFAACVSCLPRKINTDSNLFRNVLFDMAEMQSKSMQCIFYVFKTYFLAMLENGL